MASTQLIASAFAHAPPGRQEDHNAGGVALHLLRSATGRVSLREEFALGIRQTKDTREWFDYKSPQHCSVQRAIQKGLALAQGRPVIVVAHSQGTLATYRMLIMPDSSHFHAPAGTHVIRYVTLGSQLGNPAFADTLALGVHPDTFGIPYPYPAVDSWVNLHERTDPLAWPLHTALDYVYAPGGITGEVPTDLGIGFVGPASWRHSIVGYLEHPNLIYAVMAPFCQYAGCADARIRDVGAGDAPPGRLPYPEVVKHGFRYGGAGLLGATLGGIAFSQGDGATRNRTIVGAGVGAFLGAMISALLDHVAPN